MVLEDDITRKLQPRKLATLVDADLDTLFSALDASERRAFLAALLNESDSTIGVIFLNRARLLASTRANDTAKAIVSKGSASLDELKDLI